MLATDTPTNASSPNPSTLKTERNCCRSDTIQLVKYTLPFSSFSSYEPTTSTSSTNYHLADPLHMSSSALGLEVVDTAEVRLGTPSACGLPRIVLEGEHDRLASRAAAQDALDGLLLVDRAGDGLAVRATIARPAALPVVCLLAGALLGSQLQLARYKVTSGRRGHGGVEEGLDVAHNYIDNVAYGTLVGHERAQRLRGGARAAVAGALERVLRTLDEGGQLRCADVAVEDGLVADDAHLDGAPVTLAAPLLDLVDLLLGRRDTFVVDENAQDDLQAMLLARAADILEAGAVGGV